MVTPYIEYSHLSYIVKIIYLGRARDLFSIWIAYMLHAHAFFWVGEMLNQVQGKMLFSSRILMVSGRPGLQDPTISITEYSVPFSKSMVFKNNKIKVPAPYNLVSYHKYYIKKLNS